MKQKSKNDDGKKLAVGAGAVAAAALALAGGYVLWERMDKTKKAKVKAWIASARKETAKKVIMAQKISESEYQRIVDQAVKHYGSLSNINREELVKVASDLKAEWKRIKSQAQTMEKQMATKTKKPTAGSRSKTAKKSSRRAS